MLNSKKIRTLPRMRHRRDITFFGWGRDNDVKFRGGISMFTELAQREELVVNRGK